MVLGIAKMRTAKWAWTEKKRTTKRTTGRESGRDEARSGSPI